MWLPLDFNDALSMITDHDLPMSRVSEVDHDHEMYYILDELLKMRGRFTHLMAVLTAFIWRDLCASRQCDWYNILNTYVYSVSEVTCMTMRYPYNAEALVNCLPLIEMLDFVEILKKFTFPKLSKYWSAVIVAV